MISRLSRAAAVLLAVAFFISGPAFADCMGAKANGTPGTLSCLDGGIYLSAAPTLTSGNQNALLLDSSGRLMTTTSGGTITPGSLTIAPLDIASVTTGGTAVAALSAGNAAKGGFVMTSNAAGVCVDQVTTAGVATGTPSTTICVAQNQTYQLVPNTHAVSVNSSASTVTLAGEGLK